MKEFVAITDELFYRHPEIYDRLVPFTHDIACRHLLRQPLDIEGYADIIEYSIVDPTDIAANDPAAAELTESLTNTFANKALHPEREVQVCNAH